MKECFYCGDYATEREHVIPVSYTHGYRVFTGTKCVPACAECNNLLGDEVFPNVLEKARFLMSAIKRRHKKTLSLPTWSDEELQDLSATLRNSLEKKLKQREILLIRLANLAKCR